MGDFQGHPFRGNQHTGGGGVSRGDYLRESSPYGKEQDFTKAAGRTAMARAGASAPAKANVEHIKGKRVLDWGAGRGADMAFYRAQGAAEVAGYDPNHMPTKPEGMFDVVTNTFVANVIPPAARQSMLLEAWGRAKEKLIVSVRSDKIPGTPHEDGVVTSTGTFQKSFKPGELVSYLAKLFPGAEVTAGPKISGASVAIVRRKPLSPAKPQKDIFNSSMYGGGMGRRR